MKKYTRNDIVRYLYNETSRNESQEIEITLALDHELDCFHEEMNDVVDLLKQVSQNKRFTQSILEYSKNFPLSEMES